MILASTSHMRSHWELSITMGSRMWAWTAAWSCLVIVGIAIGVFGVVAATVPISDNQPLTRALGLASIGVGLFGVLITVFAFRSRERWAGQRSGH
jgi:uncharacterized membrane protein HdeD (DUF308 family)